MFQSATTRTFELIKFIYGLQLKRLVTQGILAEFDDPTKSY